jgi:hypothetical protein
MTPNQKSVWLQALRSGEFKQGRHALYNSFTDSYCCLGVAQKVCNLPAKDPGDGEFLEVCKSFVFLPQNLQRALARANDGVVSAGDIKDAFREAGYLTTPVLETRGDGRMGSTFAAIADWIENNVQPDEQDPA